MYHLHLVNIPYTCNNATGKLEKKTLDAVNVTNEVDKCNIAPLHISASTYNPLSYYSTTKDKRPHLLLKADHHQHLIIAEHQQGVFHAEYR